MTTVKILVDNKEIESIDLHDGNNKGDLISKQAVNTLVDELARAISDERCFMPRGRSTGEIMSDILNLPPV